MKFTESRKDHSGSLQTRLVIERKTYLGVFTLGSAFQLFLWFNAPDTSGGAMLAFMWADVLKPVLPNTA